MREYHKWLLSATPKCKIPRLCDFDKIPPGYKYLIDNGQSAKLTSCLRAAIIYVNLKHESESNTEASASERRVYPCECVSGRGCL